MSPSRTRAPTPDCTLVVALACASAALGCMAAPPRPLDVAPVSLAAGPLPPGPRPPQHGLPIPPLDVPWSPPVLAAGDLAVLAEATPTGEPLHVHVGPRLGGETYRERVTELFTRLGASEVVVSGTAIERVLSHDVPLPVHRTGTHPAMLRYDASAVALSGEARIAGALAEEGSAGPVLFLDDAPIDRTTWRGAAQVIHGDCSAAIGALAVGQEQSLAELESFLDHADAVLWQVYHAELELSAARLRTELAPFAQPADRARLDAQTYARHQCGHAYWQYLQPFLACTDPSTCSTAPRLFLLGGAAIAAPEPSVLVDDACPRRFGLDVIGELRGIARDAAVVAAEHLDPRWVVLADRLGTVTEVHAALVDVCTPRRRRFRERDLERAHARLATIGELLSSSELDPPGAAWHIEGGGFHVPTLGPVVQLARFDAGPGSPNETVVAEARALRQFVLGHALCRSGRPELPLAVLGIDPVHAKATALAFFYEEELFCEELPPLGWRDDR